MKKLLPLLVLALLGAGCTTAGTTSPNAVENGQATQSLGCVVPNPTIKYSVLAESSRESDVKNIRIKECSILIEKKGPSISELTQLATELGKNNENIEFKIFDDSKAYELYQKFVSTHTEDSASDSDWKFLYDHYLAWYLKVDTALSNNYLQVVGNGYYVKGQTNLPKIEIVN